MTKFSFGSDPEFMLRDTNGKYKSAIPIIGHTKEDKLDLGNGSMAFYDNVLVEVNMKPSYSKAEAIENFGDCLQRLAKVVGSKHRLVAQASQLFPADECEHEDAQVFGCDPEYCIYEFGSNGRIKRMEPPCCDKGNTFRSAGGHVHIGHDCANMYAGGKPVEIAHMMDLFLGLPSLLIDHDPTSAKRRALYGGAGTIRIQKAYGMEYRTLSDFWLASPKLVGLIHDLSAVCVDLMISGAHTKVYEEFKNDGVRQIINSGNKMLASGIVTRLKPYIPPTVYKAIEECSVPVAYDLYKEWELSAA